MIQIFKIKVYRKKNKTISLINHHLLRMAAALTLEHFFLRLILCLTARYFPDGNLLNVNRGAWMAVANLQALL